MNPVQFRYATPDMLAMIDEGERIITHIYAAADELSVAIAADEFTQKQLRDAKRELEAAEVEFLAELEGGPDSPLAGLAKTSKAYANAMEHALNGARRNGLASLVKQVDQLEIDALNTSIRVEQAKVQFSAIRHVSELKAPLVWAATGQYK